jgi:hypothetical protein
MPSTFRSCLLSTMAELNFNYRLKPSELLINRYNLTNLVIGADSLGYRESGVSARNNPLGGDLCEISRVEDSASILYSAYSGS